MSNLVTNAGHTHVDEHGHDDHHHDSGEMTVFGFWLYLMTDCILFASIFAVYAVLVNNVAGGPSGHDIFELPYVLGETACLLLSSITTASPCWRCSRARKVRFCSGWQSPSCSAWASSAWKSMNSTS